MSKTKVYVNIKQAGKRRPVLNKKEYLIDSDVKSLRDVLTFFTLTEVEKYNNQDGESYFLYDEESLGGAAQEGKVGFGRRYGGKNADPKEAVERTMLSFNDGLVRVFLNDNELTQPDEAVDIKEGDVFTFVKLTFLSGRMW